MSCSISTYCDTAASVEHPMVKGTNTLQAGMPVVFDVLCHEIKGLGMNISLEKEQEDTGSVL